MFIGSGPAPVVARKKLVKNSRWGKYLRHLSLSLSQCVDVGTRVREKKLSSMFSYQDSLFPAGSKKMGKNEKLKKKKKKNIAGVEIEKY